MAVRYADKVVTVVLLGFRTSPRESGLRRASGTADRRRGYGGPASSRNHAPPQRAWPPCSPTLRRVSRRAQRDASVLCRLARAASATGGAAWMRVPARTSKAPTGRRAQAARPVRRPLPRALATRAQRAARRSRVRRSDAVTMARTSTSLPALGSTTPSYAPEQPRTSSIWRIFRIAGTRAYVALRRRAITFRSGSEDCQARPCRTA